MLADFTNLPFEDNRFSLVVFDPPHFERSGKMGWLMHAGTCTVHVNAPHWSTGKGKNRVFDRAAGKVLGRACAWLIF